MSDLVAADVPKLQMQRGDGDLDSLRRDLIHQLDGLSWPSGDTPTQGNQ
jgi:hypothetical protein